MSKHFYKLINAAYVNSTGQSATAIKFSPKSLVWSFFKSENLIQGFPHGSFFNEK